jgi:RND family efflux transporter MFP subunit
MFTQYSLLYKSILLVWILVVFACSSHKEESKEQTSIENPIKVHVKKPLVTNLPTISASGKVVALNAATISTRLMGTVMEVKVSVGNKIKKGQILLVIHSQDLQAKIAQDQAILNEANAALKNATLDLERFTELHKQKSVSDKELENVTFQYNSIKAKVEAASQMKTEAVAQLRYSSLVAPFDGIVVQKMINEGDMASPGMPLLAIEQNSQLQIETTVTENDISKIKMGNEAWVWVKSLDKKLKGSIVEMSSSSVQSGGRFVVKIKIPDSEQKGLWAGMYVNISIPTQTNSNIASAIFIAESAVFHKNELDGIYTVGANQTALLRWVRLGKKYDNQIEIISGLAAEEHYILDADGRLHDGVPVTIQ